MRSLNSFLVFLFFCTTSIAYTTLDVFPSKNAEQILLSAIESAQHDIQITEYGFTNNKIANALIKQQKHGVKVQLLMEDSPYKAEKENEGITKRLRKAHIEIREASPEFTLTHQKTLLIDHQQAIIMTGNLTYSSFYKQRNFMVMTDEADIINNLDRVFIADWNRQKYMATPNSDFITSPDNSEKTLVSFIQEAHHELDIYALELKEKNILHALLNNKANTRIIISAESPISNKKQLCQYGIDIHQLKHIVQHAKALLRDANDNNRLAYVGSANLTYSSLWLNREAGILSNDITVIQTLHQQFEKDWKNSRPVC